VPLAGEYRVPHEQLIDVIHQIGEFQESDVVKGCDWKIENDMDHLQAKSNAKTTWYK